jgi:hypothetical protein
MEVRRGRQGTVPGRDGVPVVMSAYVLGGDDRPLLAAAREETAAFTGVAG